MGVVRWLREKMEADDGHEPNPDEVVTVAHVNIALVGMIVDELNAAGIRAEVVEQHVGFHGTVQAGIMCFEKDREAAASVVDRVIRLPSST